MAEDLDKIFQDIEAEKEARRREEELARRMLQVDEKTAVRLAEERRSKVSGFKLNLDLDGEGSAEQNAPAASAANGTDETGPLSPEEALSVPETDEPAAAPEPIPEQETAAPAPSESEEHDDPAASSTRRKKKKNPQAKTAWGCVRGIIYAVLVLAASGVLAYFVIAGGLDLTGLNKSDVKVPVTLTEEDCKSTKKVAQILEKAGIIDQPFIFEMYCKFTKADGKFMPQEEAALSADMGYETVINILKATKRATVRVTFPEGMTLAEMGAKLEKEGVCTAGEFFDAMENGEYSYTFLTEIPSDEAHAGRVYKLEGYMFPDTYDFYVGSSGETAVRKFLEAFSSRVEKSVVGEDGDSTPTSIKAKAQGMTLDEVLTLASIVQWEAGNLEDMYKVARVLRNRLDNPTVYPKLECDSTQRYINSITPSSQEGQVVENLDYDTYKRNGLPVGPINNPGMDAIDAVLNPAEDMEGYYYFATDLSTGKTYYSRTYEEHERTCRRYGIGMYA